jgi:hypothetical protein
MAGAQFIGKNSVIAAYNRRDGGTWSLTQGKKVCATGENADDLAEWIDIFSAAQSRAPYTLNLYGDAEVSDISATRRPIASWDVMINEPGAVLSAPAAGGAVGAAGRIQKHIDEKIAEKFDVILEKLDEPDETDGIDIIEIIKDYAANPHKLGHVVGAIRNLLGMNNAMPGQPAAISGLGSLGTVQQGYSGPDATTDASQSDEQKYNRLAAVLDRLEAKDPKIVEHLEKLANLAEKDPFTFEMILQRLNAL